VTVSGGTLVIGNNSAIGSGLLTLGNASIANISGNSYNLANTINLSGAAGINIGTGDSFTFNGVITNAGSLALNGPGLVSISGANANTFSGGTILSTGVLQIANSSVTPLGSGTVTLEGGTIEDNSSAAYTLSNNLVAVTNTTSYLNPTAYNGNGLTFAGNLSGAGNIVVNGSGTIYDSFVLAGSNNAFSGTLTVNSDANYQRFAFGSTNSGSPNAAFVLNSPGTDNQKFIFGDGTIDLGSLSGAGTLRNDYSSSITTLRIGDLNTSTAFTGTIVGNGGGNFSLLKVGTGTLTMTNANSYGGLTEVAGGELLTSEAQFNTTYQVDDGAILGVLNFTNSDKYIATASLTVGTTNGASMLFANVDMEVPNGMIYPLYFTNNGTCTIIIADTNNLNQIGVEYPLIPYGVYVSSGAGNFVLSPPPGLQGYVTNDLNLSEIALVVTGYASGPSTNPTNIVYSASGGTLSLSWLADHLGWYLQSATNLVTPHWVDVSGSSSVTRTNISINANIPSIFYRLSLQP
jgi:autotransporter-associated beta strand protein